MFLTCRWSARASGRSRDACASPAPGRGRCSTRGQGTRWQVLDTCPGAAGEVVEPSTVACATVALGVGDGSPVRGGLRCRGGVGSGVGLAVQPGDRGRSGGRGFRCKALYTCLEVSLHRHVTNSDHGCDGPRRHASRRQFGHHRCRGSHTHARQLQRILQSTGRRPTPVVMAVLVEGVVIRDPLGQDVEDSPGAGSARKPSPHAPESPLTHVRRGCGHPLVRALPVAQAGAGNGVVARSGDDGDPGGGTRPVGTPGV